jgi:hypothetical protein
MAVGLGLALVNGFLLFNAAMGDCAPNPDGTGCENDSVERFLMFPVFLILSVVIGVIAAWRMSKADR